MPKELPGDEFIAAHRGALDHFSQQIDLLTDPGELVIVAGGGSYEEEPHFVSGEPVAEDFYHFYDFLPPGMQMTLAEHLAQRSRELALFKAAAAVRLVVGMASMHEAIDAYEADPSTKDEQLTKDLLTYELGQFASTGFFNENDDLIAVNRTVLSGMQHYGFASSHEMYTEDEQLTSTLSLVRIGNEVITLRYDVRPSVNPLFRRAVLLLENEAFTLIPLFAGRFNTDEDIDAVFQQVKDHCTGTSAEFEIGPLLEEVRQCAHGAKHAMKLTLDAPEMHLPSAEQLQDWIHILDDNVEGL